MVRRRIRSSNRGVNVVADVNVAVVTGSGGTASAGQTVRIVQDIVQDRGNGVTAAGGEVDGEKPV